MSSLVLIPGLPNEIALGILVKLPLVFQARYRVVCRSWKHAMEPAAMRSMRKMLQISEVWLVTMDPYDGGNNILVNVSHGHFHRISAIPPLLCHHRRHSLCCEVFGIRGTEVLFAVKPVGYEPFEHCRVAGLYSYDVAHMKWNDSKLSSLPSCPGGGIWFRAVDMEGGYVYAENPYSLDASAIMRLDLKTKMWEVLPDPHVTRRRFTAVVLQNCFWIFGGIAKGSHHWCESGEIWDPTNQEWTLVPQLWPSDVFSSGVEHCRLDVAVLMDRLYAAARPHCASTIELIYYEASSKVWKHLGRVPDYGWAEVCGFFAMDQELYVALSNWSEVLTTSPSISQPLSWKSLPNTERSIVWGKRKSVLGAVIV